MDDQARERLVPRRPFLPAFMLLLLDEAPSHGYELCERLKEFGFSLSDPSPVYRELRVLEKFGLVRSLLSPHESGPVPKVYQLTPAGREALNYTADESRSLIELLNVLRRRHRARQ